MMGKIECILKTGKHREGSKVYAPGDIVYLTEKQLEAFKDKFDIVRDQPVLYDDVTEQITKKEEKDVPKLKVSHRGGGRYNVVIAETGEVLNDEYLTKEQAETFVQGREFEEEEELEDDGETDGEGETKEGPDSVDGAEDMVRRTKGSGSGGRS